MIDWHSHVLPEMDDGSRSVEQSVELISMLAEQGVDTVIATPHFYANDESVDSFLKRRASAYERLMAALPEGSPRILLGAEVSYYSGVSRLEGLSRLCIEGTKILLLEMPFARWTEHTVREISSIALSGDITLMLAHIERYMDMQSVGVFDELSECGALMQVNASFFNRFTTKRKALKMINRGKIQVIGSDTHNTTSRPPMLADAYSVIRKKYGEEFINEINEFGNVLLG